MRHFEKTADGFARRADQKLGDRSLSRWPCKMIEKAMSYIRRLLYGSDPRYELLLSKHTYLSQILDNKLKRCRIQRFSQIPIELSR
jgi:hypothetical protein